MKVGILTVLFGILSAACALAGERFYVATSGSDTNDGKSWAAAFADVQTAIDAAAAAATSASPSEVWIAKGTYKHGSPLVMKNNVAIYGGFAGSETSLDVRSGGNKTIFAGEISYSVIKNDYSQSNPLTRSAKLNSVTITSGETGIYNNYSSPEITECTVSGNAHDGIYNGYSTPAIVSCAIIGNGRCGIPNLSSSPDIINCTISGNNYGGVINEPYSSPRITNCTINGNDSFGIGSNMSSSPRITNCIIWNNTKYSIYNLDAESRPVVNSCIVYGGYNDGVNIIASDPLLGKLGDYGGKVQTIPVSAKSPAIGAGIATSSTPATDARGIVRAAAPTIGAYEYYPPISISKSPANTNVYVGKSATLKVAATGAANYQWQKLLDGEWADIGGETAPDLAFENISYDDEGVYRCVLSNEEYRIETKSATLLVAEIFIDEEPEASVNLYENTKTTLEVVARERNNSKLSYAWFADKQDGKGFVKAGSAAKVVITPKVGMVGWQYYCEVSIGGETVRTSTSTIVSVKLPAKITGNIKAIEAFEGVANPGFTVSATGDNLSYQWEISRDKGKTWQQISGATSATYIPESDPSLDGAMYRCRVYNEGSSVYSASAKFTVREAPKVEEVEVFQSKIQLPFEGSTVVAYEDYPIDLKATAKGYKIKYQWYKNGIAIKGATKATYSIKKPLESQDSYFCAVFNGNVVAQSSEFVLDIRPCPLPLDFAARSIAITGDSELFGDMKMSLLFTAKTALKLACAEYAVSNPSWSFKRTSPTSGTATLKFKLYTDDEPISKLNTLSLAYTGTLEFDEADGIYYLDLFDKKLGEFNATFTDADMEVSVKTALETLPLNKNITIGGDVVRLLDKKNFSSGETRGTYTYKWNKNGTGLLKLTWSEGKDKFTKEVSLLALTAKSGIAVVSTSWNEAKSKFMDSECVDFEIE